MLSLIVAISDNNVIGINNSLPWRLPADLQYFKQKTTGHHIIMGRKTFESIGGGRPLPNRVSVIVSRNAALALPEGCLLANSVEQAIQLSQSDSETFIIGGGELYATALPLVQRMYITRVHTQVEGDAFFPKFSATEWTLVSEEKNNADEKNTIPYSFLVYKRK